MLDLGTQLRHYLDETAPAVELEDIVTAPTGDGPVRPLRSRKPARPVAAWAFATAAALAVLLLMGGTAWLLRGEPSRVPAATTTVVPTTSVTTVTSVTTLPETPTPGSSSPPTSVPGSASLEPQVIGEGTAGSSIGDAGWVVYESVSVEALDALVEEELRAPPSEPRTLPSALLAPDGIAIRQSGRVVATSGQTGLTQWGVRIDWMRTVLLHAPDELREQSDDGELLFLEFDASTIGDPGPNVIDAGSVTTYLFDSSEELGAYITFLDRGEEPPGDLPSPAVVAVYEWTRRPVGDALWMIEVVDATNMRPIGSLTAAFSLDEMPIFTISQGNNVELTSPEWFDPDYEWFLLDPLDSMLAYVKPGDSDSPTSYEVWRSTDGLTWQNLGIPTGFPSGYLPMSISGGDGLFLAYLDDITEENEPGPDFLTIQSENGIDWVASSLPVTTDGSVHRLEAGWAVTENVSDSMRLMIWTSPDGSSWESVDTSQIPPTFAGFSHGASGWESAGNRLFVVSYRDDRAVARLWILDFEQTSDQ